MTSTFANALSSLGIFVSDGDEFDSRRLHFFL